MTASALGASHPGTSTKLSKSCDQYYIIDNSRRWSIETTITYIDDKTTEEHEYTDQEVEAWKNEGYIQETKTQLLARAWGETTT